MILYILILSHLILYNLILYNLIRIKRLQPQREQSWQLWKRINPGYDSTQEPKESVQKEQHVDFPQEWKETMNKSHFLKKDRYSEFVEARARFALLNGDAGGNKNPK